MPIKYILPTFSYTITQNSSPFHVIITSSSNKLHASMNNHFKCSIEFNHTPSIQRLWHEIHISSILFSVQQRIQGRT